MAKLGDIPLLDLAAGYDCGGAFLLAKPCDAHETIKLTNGWEVELQEDNPYVVARGRGAGDHNAAYVESLEAVQQGLDLLAICNLGLNTIREASTECIIWWTQAGVQALRVNAVQHLGISMSTIRVASSDIDGSERLLIPNIGQLKHHESMRFYRLSQLTDDVFDAYRNLWLAMEALLDFVHPRPPKASETTWLKQAFSEVLRRRASSECLPDMETLVRALAESTDAEGSVNYEKAGWRATNGVLSLPSADVFITEQYKETRCRLFHSGRRLSEDQLPTLQPDRLEDRAYLRDRLVELSLIFRQAACVSFGLRTIFGPLPAAILDTRLASRMVGEANIAVTHDPELINLPPNSIGGKFSSLSRLHMVPAACDITALRAFLGSADLAVDSVPSSIVATILMLGTTCVLRNELEATLQLAGISTLEVFMAFWSQDTNRPEYVFPDPPWLC